MACTSSQTSPLWPELPAGGAIGIDDDRCRCRRGAGEPHATVIKERAAVAAVSESWCSSGGPVIVAAVAMGGCWWWDGEVALRTCASGPPAPRRQGGEGRGGDRIEMRSNETDGAQAGRAMILERGFEVKMVGANESGQCTGLWGLPCDDGGVGA